MGEGMYLGNGRLMLVVWEVVSIRRESSMGRGVSTVQGIVVMMMKRVAKLDG